MFVVGHIVVYGILETENRLEVPLWVHLAVWPGLALVLSIGLLQPVKGAVVGLQYALGMHGFGAARSAAREQPQEQARDGPQGAEHHGSSHLHGT